MAPKKRERKAAYGVVGKSLEVAYIKLRENTPNTCLLFCLNNVHP